MLSIIQLQKESSETESIDDMTDDKFIVSLNANFHEFFSL